MRIHLLNLWDHFRGSFWFLPTLVISVAVLCATVLPWIDRISLEWIQLYFSGIITTRDIALLLLSHIASSMITVAGIVFSLTVLILSNASSSYGSRILRTYMQDPVTQFAIGAFVAPSLYCFLVLRTLGTSYTEVPHLSVAVGVVFAVFNFGVLIYFVHHVAMAIQASQVIQTLSEELNLSIDHLFPTKLEETPESPQGRELSDEEINQASTTKILANREGYLQIVDSERIVEIAREHDIVVVADRRPGDFITREQAVFSVIGLDSVPLELVEHLNETLFVGSRRTPRQDVECAVHEMVEVAVRALSPGINDPFTAITCLDYLSASLAKLSKRQIPSAYRYDEQHQLRLISYPFTFNGVLDSSLNQIRQNGSGSAAVLIRLMERLAVLAACVTRESDQKGVRKHADMVLREAKRSLPEPEDLKILLNRYDEFLKAISGQQSVESEITHDEN